MWHEMCRINRLSLGCAHALEPIVLVESESRACMGIGCISLGHYGPYSLQCLISSNDDTLSEIVQNVTITTDSTSPESKRCPVWRRKLKPKSQILLQGQ